MGILFAPLLFLVYPASMLVSVMSSFTFPALTTLNTNRVSHREVGLLMGVTTAINSLMNIAGPLWAGLAFDHIMPGSPYWIGAIILAAGAGILAWRSPKSEQVP